MDRNVDFEQWWRHHGHGLFDGRLDKEDLRGAFGAGQLFESDRALLGEAPDA